jgi:hypothetical protein
MPSSRVYDTMELKLQRTWAGVHLLVRLLCLLHCWTVSGTWGSLLQQFFLQGPANAFDPSLLVLPYSHLPHLHQWLASTSLHLEAW